MKHQDIEAVVFPKPTKDELEKQERLVKEYLKENEVKVYGTYMDKDKFSLMPKEK